MAKEGILTFGERKGNYFHCNLFLEVTVSPELLRVKQMACVGKHSVDRRRKSNEALPFPVTLDRGGATVRPERRQSCP